MREKGVKTDSQVSGLEVYVVMVMEERILRKEYTWKGTKKNYQYSGKERL